MNISEFKALNAEKYLIGAILSDHQLLGKVSDIRPEHFYNGLHAEIFKTIESMVKDGLTPDPVSISERLKDKITLLEILDIQDLGSIEKALIEQHQSSIIEQYRKREILNSLRQKAVLLKSESSNDVMNAVVSDLQELEQGESDGYKHISVGNTKFFKMVDNIYKNGKPQGLKTGYIDIDDRLGGLQKKTLVLLGARPSQGKTALALNIAKNIADTGESVGIVSLEMGDYMLSGRLTFSAAKVNSNILNTGKISQEEYEKLYEVKPDIDALPIQVDECNSSQATAIISRANLLKKTHGISLLIIDYIQLMDMGGGKKQENRNLEVGKISRALKLFAKKADIPVLALCQLSREAEGKMPQLSNLRDSGTLEQDADAVLFLYQPWKHDEGADKNLVLVNLAKNRQGETGDFKLTFLPQYTQFLNYAPAPPEDVGF